MLEYRNKILFVGYGAVAQCTLPILVKHIKVPARDITVMDFEDRRAVLAPWLKRGVNFVQQARHARQHGRAAGQIPRSRATC